MADTENKYCFLIPLTEEQKTAFDRRRKREGRTCQGVMQMLVDRYIRKGLEDGHSDD